MNQMLSLNNVILSNRLNNIKREILFTVDMMGILTDIEPEIVFILGYSPKDMIGLSFNEFLSDEVKKFTFSNSSSPVNNITLNLKHKNNELIYFDINYKFILNSNNENIGIYASMMDISKYKTNEQRLNIINSILDNSKDITYHYQVSPERKFLYLSKSVETVLGYSADFYYNNPLYVFESSHPEDVSILEKKAVGKVEYSKPLLTRWKHKNGSYLCLEDCPIPVYDYNGNITGVQGICRDISEKLVLQEKLKHLLSHDVFTGLRNRIYFDEQMNKCNETEDVSLGIIMCDLDNLKVINDSFGHDKGDLLIKNSSILLSKLSNNNRVIARLGGDEFAVLIKNATEIELTNICQELNLLISKFNYENKNLKIKMSLGSAFSESSLNKVSSILKVADTNMYINKKKRKTSLA